MRTISITSGKGGVGKTNVAVNLALALAEKGRRVLLLDADLGLANVDVVLGLYAERTLADVLDADLPLASIAISVAPHCDVLPASSGVLRLERLSSADRGRLIAELDELNKRYDVLLVDTGAGIGENVLFFNDLADQVLLITVPEPTALTDTYAMIKVLSRTYNVTSLQVVVNQAATAAVAAHVHERLHDVSRRFLGTEVTLVGHLPSDPAVADSVSAREPLLHHSPDAPFARGIRTLAAHLNLTLDSRGPARTESFWRAWLARRRLAPEGSRPPPATTPTTPPLGAGGSS